MGEHLLLPITPEVYERSDVKNVTFLFQTIINQLYMTLSVNETKESQTSIILISQAMNDVMKAHDITLRALAFSPEVVIDLEEQSEDKPS